MSIFFFFERDLYMNIFIRNVGENIWHHSLIVHIVNIDSFEKLV